MRRIQFNGLAYYQFESLADQPGMEHAIFTRLGGVSEPPFDSLNVGATVGDDPQAVRTNRERVLAAMGLPATHIVTGHQVHSANVAQVRESQGGQVLHGTDGLVTDESIGLLLRFADCVPILLFDPVKRVAGLLHAGWRGTGARIAARGVSELRACFGSKPSDIIAGIGPSIGPCCYEVGDDFESALCTAWPQAVRFIHSDNGAIHADLWAMNRQQLLDAGVKRVEVSEICTACHRDEFYSHRGDNGRTGRFAVAVRLRPGARR